MSAPSPMSREEKVAVVETFLEGMASGELEGLPIAPELTLQSPLVPKLSGPAAFAYMKAVSAGTSAIQVLQHIVEGNYVVTLSENETTNGRVSVLAMFRLESGRIKDTRVFYDTRQVVGPKAGAPGSTDPG